MIRVPFVPGMIERPVLDALEGEGRDYYPVQLDPEDDFAYARYWRGEWGRHLDLIFEEEDVLPPLDSIAALPACKREWCALEVSLGDHLSARTLGLVKFSYSLQHRLPDLAFQALPLSRSGDRSVHWRSVDSAIIRELDFAGVTVHIHQPPALHLHRYPGSPPGGPAPATSDTPA